MPDKPKVTPVRAVVVDTGTDKRTYRSPVQAAITVTDILAYRVSTRLQIRDGVFRTAADRHRIYTRTYPRVLKVMKRMMGEA